MSDYKVSLSEDEMHILLRALYRDQWALEGASSYDEYREVEAFRARLFQMQAANSEPSERLIGRIEQTLDDRRERVRARQAQRLRDLQEAFGAPSV